MAFTTGKYVICAAPDCDCVELETVQEDYDAQARIFVGEQRCPRCGAGMLYSRKPSTPQEIEMAKKKKPGSKARGKNKSTDRADVTSHRMNTIKGNGALPTSTEVAPVEEKVNVGEAMRLAVEELGEVIIDDKLAPQQLRDLADTYEEVARRKAAYTAKADEAKVAKKSLESAQDLLLEKVRLFTHPTPLPLIDQAEREEDEAAMLAGGEVDPDDDTDEADAAFI